MKRGYVRRRWTYRVGRRFAPRSRTSTNHGIVLCPRHNATCHNGLHSAWYIGLEACLVPPCRPWWEHLQRQMSKYCMLVFPRVSSLFTCSEADCDCSLGSNQPRAHPPSSRSATAIANYLVPNIQRIRRTSQIAAAQCSAFTSLLMHQDRPRWTTACSLGW